MTLRFLGLTPNVQITEFKTKEARGSTPSSLTVDLRTCPFGGWDDKCMVEDDATGA
jgi:hypothetical protein